MRLLLDTHVLLWALSDDPRLTARARKLIDAENNELFFSVVSLWEIAIKHALGRGDMPISAAATAGHCEEAGYLLLAMTAQGSMPFRVERTSQPTCATALKG